MQDIHHIGGGSGGGGGGGRYFGGGDRRLRPHNHLNHQALKCPRCDSLNTKFCYYNNYNLSQPRHFCKSCRRYWTKGGVLRNVPVGGGCRKTKRSRQKTDGDAAKERRSNVQSSSSESSSLTAATAAATTPTSTVAAEEGSAPSNSTAVFTGFVTANPNFDAPAPIVNRSTDGQIFATDTFASLMTSPPDMLAAFGVADIPTAPYERSQRGSQATLPGNPAPTSESEFKMQGMNDDGLAAAALEWGSGGEGSNGGDQGLFDLTAAVDPAYWSQPQWTDSDNQSLNYLP